ncbi:hypothetical protein [Klebsiella variicola]|uniref:hypothetical protein n=1 Tax=Klebsiella variicola TaxID=244366 RepID=UPI003AF413D9
MDTNFFSHEQTISAINKFLNELEKYGSETKFQKDRNNLTESILKNFIGNPTFWLESSTYNTKNSGGYLLEALGDRPINDENINLVFSICYGFILEAYILSNQIEETFSLSKRVKDFGIYRHSEFDEKSKMLIDFTLREMPIRMLKTFINSNEIQPYKNITTNLKDAKEFNNSWQSDFNSKKDAVDRIKGELDKYYTSANFTLLHEGFNNLSNKKNRDIFWTRTLLFILSLLILTPLIYEIYYTHTSAEPINLTAALPSLIPVMSITIIFIYFFRVALSNYNSLRAQIIQLELRKSLIQFIQDYPKHAKEISNGNPDTLKKFEDIIFSNIMTSDDRIPPTFDGVEQIANLIKTIKAS